MDGVVCGKGQQRKKNLKTDCKIIITIIINKKKKSVCVEERGRGVGLWGYGQISHCITSLYIYIYFIF